VFLDVLTLQQPEAYIGNAGNLFDESGNLANDSIREFSAKYMQAFASWVETITSGRKQ
jgi:chromate reductase, NAD(P)H dehydrogenase (quinone)